MSTAAASALSPTRSRRRGRKATATASRTPATWTTACAVSHPYSPQIENGEPREAWKPSVRS